VQQQQPNNKEEGPPRPLGKEATTGGEHRDFDKDSLSHCLQTLAELKVLQYLKLLVSPYVTEDRGADKYSLIAVVIASKAVPDSVDPSDHSKTPSRISKEMFEGTTHDMSVGKGAMDQFQGIHWRKGVGMKEKEDLTMSHGRTRVHVRGPGPLTRPEDPSASGCCLFNSAVITRGGNDDFRIFNSSNTLEAVKGPGKTTSVIP